MPASIQTDHATVWPEGVIARYLTVVGATVDLTGEGYDTKGVCGGCAGTPYTDGYGSSHIDVARRWAQAHAEKCRALPRPTA
ncbi:hypothetical protein [Streptomyces sp. SCL15-4]|uniref:hypothetical protein n=1 Tax=Streptomyces sp. SCL15-4 TaxID=2967221 RepID=UPI002966F664|nr:hypothetical protein [Streptomyces sp. SCL15-4]